jgi:diguanylate cyclase (GGDEF)-like protein
MPPIRTVSLCLLLLAGLIGNARAADSGIARIERAQAAMDASGGPSQLLQTAFVATGRSDRLDGAVSGNGWWRVHPAPGSGDRALLVFHPYSAHVTVLMAPDFKPQVQTLFDANLDARYSRRALVFPLHGDGVVYIGVDQARYPLQVAVQDVRTHAVSDRNHLKVLYSATGVLVGVCLVALVFFLVLRDRVYLLYAGCMAMQLMYVLCAYGEAYALPGLRGLARFGAPGIWFVATVSTIVSVYFLLEFGGLRARTPWLSRALTVVGAWMPMLLLALLVAPWPRDKHWFPGLGNLSLLLANLLAILALGLAWRRGSRHAGMMLLAWIPLVAVSTARALQLSAGAPLKPWLEYGLPLVLAYTAVVLMLGMADRMRAFRRERDRAQLEAERDPLTGVFNRAGIKRRLDWALAATQSEYQPLAVLFLDIDHFKPINDEHGHAVGDACLGALVRVITAELQYGDQVGRLGGEEFLLVLPGSDRRRAQDTAEHIRRSVEMRCREIAGVPLAMTVSIGVAESRQGDSVADIIARADAAMYTAKRGGRNRVASAETVAPEPARVD